MNNNSFYKDSSCLFNKTNPSVFSYSKTKSTELEINLQHYQAFISLVHILFAVLLRQTVWLLWTPYLLLSFFVW